MGNTSSTVTAGIKDQVNSESNAVYRLADVTGNGELAELAKEALRQRTNEKLDLMILQKVGPMLHNDGLGDYLWVNDVIAQRHKERTGNQFVAAQSTEKKFVCWKLNARGAVGETLLHTCFLSGLPNHMKLLAERLLHVFPNIINDFYINDEYFGETVLHMGIVSEEPEIVRYLLKCGADVNARCSGNFFTCDDQKGSRSDHPNVEYAVISKHTKYKGHLYWGEYPLSFAAVLSQRECFRMLEAKGADLNAQDSNGNTVLHICTIHENWEMFKLALSLGADLHIQNRQNLTPFTLSAFLAKKTMMERIGEEERTMHWMYGSVQSVAYPLEHLDSIQPNTGNINRDSALAIVVYGEKSEHLSLLPNLLEKLVQRKWTVYGRKTLFSQLWLFVLYFLTVMVCFMLRPTPFERADESIRLLCVSNFYDLSHMTAKNIVYHVLNLFCIVGAALYILQMNKHIRNVGSSMYFLSLSGFPAKAIFLISCVLMLVSFVLRLFCLNEAEDILWVVVVLLTGVKFLFFCRGFKSVGPFVLMLYKIIIRDLMRFFLIYLVIVIGFSQAFYIIFLSYKKGKEKSIMSNVAESFVRPHETRVRVQELLNNSKTKRLHQIIRMFIMSLTEFATFFEQLEDCEHSVIGKITFMVYLLLVTVLLMNMLIAMMTNTYIEVSGNSLEWLRQWSAIILMMEMSFDNNKRLQLQRKYSVPMDDGKRIALLLNTRLGDTEYEESRAAAVVARRRFREDRRRPPGARNTTAGANYFRPKTITKQK